MLDEATIDFDFPKCHFVKKSMANRFIEFRCKNLSSYLNKEIKKQKHDGASLKASKSIAMREMIKRI